MDFKPGDQVQLISGGPVMAVHGINQATGLVLCVRFTDDHTKPQTHDFKPEVLKHFK